MITWNYCGIILFNSLLIILIHVQKSNLEKCYCYVNSTNNNNNNTNVIQLTHCSLTQSLLNYSEEISCERVNKFICIGPYNSNDDTSNVQLSINPWAFSNLFINNLIDTLQLDFNIPTHQINALTLAGTDGLINLLARTSLMHWDSCSFSGLINLREITLNCKAKYPEYLIFTSLISVIRFVDCEGVALQFYCIQCIQNPNVHVIRIRPGPPLRQYLVKFTRFSSSSKSSPSSSSPSPTSSLLNDKLTDHLPLDSCVYGVCSDDMLCRNNLPLKQAQSGIDQPEKPIITIVSNNQFISPTINSMELFSSTQPPTLEVPTVITTVSTVIQSANTTPPPTTTPVFNNIVVLTKYGHSKTDHRHKIWIVSAIILLIILFIVTLGILIIINYQRKSKHRLKILRSNKLFYHHRNHGGGIQHQHQHQHHHNNTLNGKTNQHNALITVDDENRIELPDIVSCK
ncbi:unnamed protein product [Schistosoma turkestanicum]|nr:unnamed protein product [Schistosoma turkestanicum]